MKKKLTLVLVLAIVFSLLTACSEDSGSSVSDTGNYTGRDDAVVTAVDSTDAEPIGDDSTGTDSTRDTDDTVYTITVQNHDSEKNASARMLAGWAKDVEEASGGRINVIVYNGGVLGGPTAALDLLDSDSVDVAWGLMTFFQGEFKKSEVISLPMLGIKSADQGSNVMWELYNDYDLIKSDYKDWKVLYLMTNTNCPLITTTKITSPTALKGMNIRVTSGPIADFFADLGASPVSTGLSEIYTCLNNKTLDGSVQGWDAVNAFQLYEVCDYFVNDTLVSLGNFVLMSWDCYNSLPSDLQAVIDKYSGDYFLQYSAYLWKDLEIDARKGVENCDGECYSLNDATRQKFQSVADEVVLNWCDNTENGQEIYDTAKALVDKYAYLG